MIKHFKVEKYLCEQGCHLMKSKKRKTRLKIRKKAEREIEKAEKKRKSIFLRDFTISKSFNHFFFYL
jgi:hypothetical protein